MLPRPLDTVSGASVERHEFDEGGRDSTTSARPTDYDGFLLLSLGNEKKVHPAETRAERPSM
jgi:hypothetical protein